MPIGILFWVLFVVWILFGGMWWRSGRDWQYGWGGNTILLIILVFLLGWGEFGFILQGGRGSPFH